MEIPRRRIPAPGVQRPRVVVVAQASPARGGIATYAETLVGDLVLGASFDIRLLNTTRKAVRRAGVLSFANARNALVDSFRTFRAARRADIVHVQTALMPLPPLLRAFAVCRAARLAGAAVLCHVHTGLVNSGPNERFEPSRVERWFLRRLAFVDQVLTVSEAGTRGLEPFMPRARLRMIDNAVDVESFSPSDGVDAPVATMLFVGTVARRKGLVDLVSALGALKDRGVDGWRLEIVGSGSEAGDEEARVVEKALRARGWGSSLLGPLHGPALRDRLGSASILVLPSHYEGQPIGIMEAMASGLPVVATRVGGIPDMVRDGVDGLLVDPSDPPALSAALERLVADPELRLSMGASARARAEELFDLPALRTNLAELYRSVLARRLRPGGAALA